MEKDLEKLMKQAKLELEHERQLSKELGFDDYHTYRIISDEEGYHAQFFTFGQGQYRTMSREQLLDEIKMLKEELQERREEFEEISDLEPSDYKDFDFETEQEYKEKLHDLDSDIFSLETHISLVESFL